MSDVENKIKEHYDKYLKANEYVDMVEKSIAKGSEFHRVPLTFFYEILRSDKFKGTKLLEIGSGVLVHYAAVASGFYPNIIMSDYVEDNCEELKRWLCGQSNVKQFLDIPAELEGYGRDLEAGRKLLENRIRENVKQVVRCDVLNDSVLLEEVKVDVAPPYDLITSVLCLEAAVPNFEGFVLCLKRINKLLRVGGGLLLVGFLKGKSWPSGDNRFQYIEVSENDLRNALRECGFGKIDMITHGKIKINYDHEGFYCLIAEKIE